MTEHDFPNDSAGNYGEPTPTPTELEHHHGDICELVMAIRNTTINEGIELIRTHDLQLRAKLETRIPSILLTFEGGRQEDDPKAAMEWATAKLEALILQAQQDAVRELGQKIKQRIGQDSNVQLDNFIDAAIADWGKNE